MSNNLVFNTSTAPLYAIDYGTSTDGMKRLLLTNKSGSLIVDSSLVFPNSQGLMFTTDSGVINIANANDIVAIKFTNPNNSGVNMVVSSVIISSYDTSINARFSYHPTFKGGDQTVLTPVSNNSGSSATSNLTVTLNHGTIETKNELVISNVLYPTGITTFQIQGGIILVPNTSIGFRGIGISKGTHMSLSVSWLEIPTALFY